MENLHKEVLITMDDFTGFHKNDFNTFEIDGLAERMTAIQQRIQPKFKTIGPMLVDFLSEKLNIEMHLHIARHARRTVNPPNDTWLAIANNKRGYKKHPHFQVGLWDDRLFVWLAFIYELPDKTAIAKAFIEQEEKLKEIIPADYLISMDHMKKDATPVDKIDTTKSLERFRDVKKAELLIGKYFDKNDPIVQSGDDFMKEVKQIYTTLIPVYKLAYESIEHTFV